MQGFCVLRTHPPFSVSVCITNEEAPSNFGCPEFLLGFYYMGMIISLTCHMTEFNFQSFSTCRPLPEPPGSEVRMISHGSKSQTPNYMVHISHMASPHPYIV